MKKIFLLTVLGSIFLSCSNENSIKVEIYPSDTVMVENNYPPIENQGVIEAINHLRICSSSDTNTVLPNCAEDNFRIFPLGPKTPLEKGFILEMKEGVHDSPVKQVMVIQKMFNKYKMVNRYLGFLVEYRTTASGINNIVMGYKDIEMGVIVIRHEWQKDKYEPVDVEEINGYFIKESLKDSINDLFISSFNAGY